MKAFMFRLERLLHLRARVERERAQALGAAMRDETHSREASVAADARVERVSGQVADTVGATAKAGTLRNLTLALDAVVGESEAARESLALAADALVAERERFGAARRERRVVERLRERREAAWREDAIRREQIENDETAANRRSGRKEP